MVSRIVKKINNYTNLVKNNQIKTGNCSCPKCREKPLYFSPHEKKRRLFYVIEGRLVYTVESILMRWRCPLCKKTWTQYPDHALPYKRYVKEQVLELSGKYLHEESATYRKVVRTKNLPIFHEGKDAEESGKSLSGSTVWHWLCFTGSLIGLVLDCLGMIKEKAPESGIFRKIFMVSGKKYRSELRKQSLKESMKMLAVKQEYEKVFGREIFFLHFATDG